MGEHTDISWAHKTFNPWMGCAKKSPACRFCYAERDNARWKKAKWGVTEQRIVTSDAYWAKVNGWNRAAAQADEPTRVFCASWADVFERHPDVVQPRARLLQLIEQTPALTWMLLTKRPENVEEFAERWAGGWPPNVWLGASAETQKFADERIPLLGRVPAAVRFISAGPTLGPILLGEHIGDLHWVITEGESGPKARPSHPDWFRMLRDQCTAAGIAYHHKQNGEWVDPDQIDTAGMDDVAWNDNGLTIWPDGRTAAGQLGTCVDGSATLWRVGRQRAGRHLDGRVWAEFPDREKVAA
jgi:protein gp37